MKYSGAVPYVGKHTDKVIKAFKKLDVNIGVSNSVAMVKRISNDQTEKREKADQSGVYKINCKECDGMRRCLHWGNWKSRKFIPQMNEHAKSKAKRNDKSLFGKHCNDIVP